MKKPLISLIDPITGRRFLPHGYIWIGNENNVEEFISLAFEERNIRDLKARFLLLKHKVDYILANRQILPTATKYYSNAQAIDELPNALLRHVNGVLKAGRPGIDFVEYKSDVIGKICIVQSDISETDNKFIAPSDIDVADIKNYIKEYKEFKTDVHNHFNTHFDFILDVNNKVVGIISVITPIINTYSSLQNIVNNNYTVIQELTKQIQEINNVTNNIVKMGDVITNLGDTITSIDNRVTNNEYNVQNVHYSLEQVINNITNITQMVNNVKNEITHNISNITNELTNNFSIELGNIEIKFTSQLEIINNIVANAIINLMAMATQITELQTTVLILKNKMDTIVSGENQCIAWAMGNDCLNVTYNT